jgi:hypothetical protein
MIEIALTVAVFVLGIAVVELARSSAFMRKQLESSSSFLNHLAAMRRVSKTLQENDLSVEDLRTVSLHGLSDEPSSHSVNQNNRNSLDSGRRDTNFDGRKRRNRSSR